MADVGIQMWQFCLQMGGRWRILGTAEQMSDESRTHGGGRSRIGDETPCYEMQGPMAAVSWANEGVEGWVEVFNVRWVGTSLDGITGWCWR